MAGGGGGRGAWGRKGDSERGREIINTDAHRCKWLSLLKVCVWQIRVGYKSKFELFQFDYFSLKQNRTYDGGQFRICPVITEVCVVK